MFSLLLIALRTGSFCALGEPIHQNRCFLRRPEDVRPCRQTVWKLSLLRFLGEGSFAEVYVGEDIRLNTLAAIKVLHTRLTQFETRDFHRGTYCCKPGSQEYCAGSRF